MRRASKHMALFLAVLMVVAMLPSRLTPVLAATTSTFIGDGFTVEITVHSNWATGHNTQFRITNTSNDTWPHWVFSMNRPLGLRVPTGWGTPWQNNGLFVHQDASETTIRNLGHQAPVAPGGSVTIHTYSNTQRFFMPTDFRLRPAELQLVPIADRTYEVLEHSTWQGAFFNHAISAVNVSNRIIQNWEIHFDVAGGGMNIDSVPNARIIQSTSSSAILAYIPGDGQVLHPGQNIHLGMIGTFIPGSHITNVRIYEHVGTPYGGWPDFDPGTPQGGGGDDSGPTPTPTPGPNGPDDDYGPSIEVLTEFPDGETITTFVDVEYIATPSPGAYITHVFIYRGDEDMQIIYRALSVAPQLGQLGVLGQARIPIFAGANHNTFIVRDSTGREARFEVENVPYLNLDGMILRTPYDLPEFEYREFFINERGVDYWIYTSLLRLWTGLDERNFDTIRRIEEAIAPLGGAIVGFMLDSGWFTITLPNSTREELTEIGESLMRDYPDLFVSFNLVMGEFVDCLFQIVPSYDPWWTERESHGIWPFRGSRYTHWGLRDTNFPKAWQEFGAEQRSNVRIGVIDSNIMHNHADLLIPSSNIDNRLDPCNMEHGTWVMGIIAAVHGNGIGLAGGINISRDRIFGFGSNRYYGRIMRDGDREPVRALLAGPTQASVLEGLRWHVVNNRVRVVNFSARGIGFRYEYNRQLNDLIERGFCFIVVQSAVNRQRGNIVPSELYVAFAAAYPFETLRPHIMTVGASDRGERIASFTAFGHNVDVLAPGVAILGPAPEVDSTHINFSSFTFVESEVASYWVLNSHGTSASAPIVTSLVALIMSEFPEFAAFEARTIVTQSAYFDGATIEDNRSEVLAENRLTYHQIDAYAAMRRAEGLLGRGHWLNRARLIGQIIPSTLQPGTREPGASPPFPIGRLTLSPHIPSGQPPRTAYTCENGFFRFDDVLPGAYILSVYCPNGIFRSEPWHGIILSQGVTVENRVWRLARTNVHAAPTDGIGEGDTHIRVSDVAIPAIAPLTLYNERALTPLAEATLVREPLTLEFRRGINVTEGDPCAVIMSVDGRFSIRGLEPGNYTVIAFGDGFAPTINHVMVYWYDGDDTHEYFLNQRIYVTPLGWNFTPREITPYFTCPIFLALVRFNLDKGPGDPIFDYEVADILSISFNEQGITSLAGIEFFTSLVSLYAAENSLTYLDISNNSHLGLLEVWSNDISGINIANNRYLWGINVSGNNLTELDISANRYLWTVHAWGNRIVNLDTSQNPYLELLSIGVNNLAQIDVSNNRYLSMLSVWDNQLTALDVLGKENLQLLSAQNNRMTSHNDVIGWQEIGLILNDTFIFYPQGVAPVGLALNAEWEWEIRLDLTFEAFAFGLDDPSLHFTAEGFTGAGVE